MSGILRDLIQLYNKWGVIIFSLQLLSFVVYLSNKYNPVNTANMYFYLGELFIFLLINAFLSAIEGKIIEVIIDFLKPIFRIIDRLS